MPPKKPKRLGRLKPRRRVPLASVGNTIDNEREIDDEELRADDADGVVDDAALKDIIHSTRHDADPDSVMGDDDGSPAGDGAGDASGAVDVDMSAQVHTPVQGYTCNQSGGGAILATRCHAACILVILTFPSRSSAPRGFFAVGLDVEILTF